VSFYRIRAGECAKYVFTLQSRYDRFFAEEGQSNNKMQWNNKPLIGVLVKNTRGHFTHKMQLKISERIIDQNTE